MRPLNRRRQAIPRHRRRTIFPPGRDHLFFRDGGRRRLIRPPPGFGQKSSAEGAGSRIGLPSTRCSASQISMSDEAGQGPPVDICLGNGPFEEDPAPALNRLHRFDRCGTRTRGGWSGPFLPQRRRAKQTTAKGRRTKKLVFHQRMKRLRSWFLMMSWSWSWT